MLDELYSTHLGYKYAIEIRYNNKRRRNMTPNIIAAIVTLVVGLAIVVISFFIGDGKKESETDGTLADSREKLEKQLDEYCDLLVEKKKNDLKKQGDEVKNNMKKGLDEVKASSKKELAEIRDSSKKEIDEYRESARKEIDEFKASTDKRVNDMTSDATQRIDKAMADYESSIEAAKDKMRKELEACSSQLSEKAKKQMIDYINQSLTEAYESYDPDDTSEKEPITYDESAKSEDEKENDSIANEPAATETGKTDNDENDKAETDIADQNDEDTAEQKSEESASDTADAAAKAEDGQTAGESAKAEENEASEQKAENTVANEDQESVVSIEDSQVTDSAFTVVEADNPEKMAAAIEEGNVVPAPQRSRNNRSKKKKKKKAAQNRPLDIWDEGVDTETQVAELHKKGLSIMEIANKLGIGVGEAKVMIDQINETKTTENSDETGRQ